LTTNLVTRQARAGRILACLLALVLCTASVPRAQRADDGPRAATAAKEEKKGAQPAGAKGAPKGTVKSPVKGAAKGAGVKDKPVGQASGPAASARTPAGPTAGRKAAPEKAPAPPPRTPAANPEELVQRLLTAWFERHPDQALTRAWPGAARLGLGTHGTTATLRWRGALDDAQRDLARFTLEASAPAALRAERQALADWIALEKLELGRNLVAQDPSGYVRRARRLLLALLETPGLDDGPREARASALLAELPGYFADARASLIAPRQEWVELALLDLADLEELIRGARPPAPAGKPTAGKPAAREPGAPALRALTDFRTWLLELHPPAGDSPTRLRAEDFARIVRLATGCELELGELEARALREIARADLGPRRAGPDLLERAGIPPRIATAAKRALELAQDAKLLNLPVYPKNVEFLLEESARTQPELLSLRAGPRDTLRAWVAAPHASWSVARARTRGGALQPFQQLALGVRHGMVGEALYLRQARASQRPLAAFVGNRAVREGLGLYALDWIRRVDWVENPFLADERLLGELERQRLHEAARFLAALELHAEGLSLNEAALAFARRTGVDADTAMVESLAARRDPLHGIGHVGAQELARLEQNLARFAHGPRAGLGLTLATVLAHPELTPARLAPLAAEALARPR